VGDRAPDFELQSAAGEPVSLNGVLEQGDDVLLIFLRHLG
jgi:peroxiredoxin